MHITASYRFQVTELKEEKNMHGIPPKPAQLILQRISFSEERKR